MNSACNRFHCRTISNNYLGRISKKWQEMFAIFPCNSEWFYIHQTKPADNIKQGFKVMTFKILHQAIWERIMFLGHVFLFTCSDEKLKEEIFSIPSLFYSLLRLSGNSCCCLTRVRGHHCYNIAYSSSRILCLYLGIAPTVDGCWDDLVPSMIYAYV